MEKQNNLKNLVPKKPREPIIVLFISSITIIIGLNLNFISLKVFGYSFFAYKGYQLQYSLFLFSFSFFLSLFACSVYFFGKNQKFINLSRDIAIIGILPGMLDIMLIFTGNISNRNMIISQIQKYNNVTISQANYLVNSLTPDIGLAISFSGLFLMLIGAYLVNNTKLYVLEENDNSIVFPDISKLDLSKEKLALLWYCPKDNNRLISNENRLVPNPEFIVSFERLENNLENAIAMKMLTKENLPYAKELAIFLLEKSKRTEIYLVSTICSVCNKKYISPRLSDWNEY